ncbi:MAG: endonuclease III [Oscillospiraceae bacterium]
MTKKQRALIVIEQLKNDYPDAKCSLEYSKPYELLIATRLSAQCTDARVNIVTKVLFEKFSTLESLANASVEELEELIHSCGFYRTKSADVKKMCNQLINDYNGELPNSIEELTKLSGIGRKTANLIMGDIFGQPAYVCDTHCIRITNHIGLTQGKDAAKVEEQLRLCIPPNESNDFCHRLVLHGRAVCTARSPKCSQCSLNTVCIDGISQIKSQKE